MIFFILVILTVLTYLVFQNKDIRKIYLFLGGSEKIYDNVIVLGKEIEKAGGTDTFWLGPEQYTATMEPEDVQKVLDTCLDKDGSFRFLQKWLGNGLFVAPVELWKEHRRILLPIFRNKIIDDYIQVFGEQGSILVERLEEKAGKPEFDMFKFITSCMLDIVYETAMGEKMDMQHEPETPYLRARGDVMNIICMRMFKAWYQPDFLFKLTKYAKIQKDGIDLTHKFTDEVVLKKRAALAKGQFTEGRKDLLELLLIRNDKFTNEQLREHIDSITIAGNDTTSLVIAYTLVLLGANHYHQDMVYKELQEIFDSSTRSPTKEDMNKMVYLERVIKESMRLYTVVPLLGRRVTKGLQLSNGEVQNDMGCIVMTFLMHRRKDIWGPDADEFNPDRFLPEHTAKRHPSAFIPFSYGARNCIGRHFGMMAMKSLLSNILRSYKVTAKIPQKFRLEILLLPTEGHMLTLEKRVH